MAAKSPMAVATSASDIPGATIASVACWTLPSEEKALMIPHTVPKSPTYGLVLPTVASVARLCSSRSISFSCATRIARREPSSSCSLPAALCRSRANSRKPNSKMPAMPVAPPFDSMARYSVARSSPDQNRPSNRSASRRARPMMRRLRKMIAQELSDASSSSAMTICTGTLACTMSLRIESGSPIGNRLGAHGFAQELRQTARAERRGVHAGDAHLRLDQQLRAPRRPGAVDALGKAQRRCTFRAGCAGDLELIVEPGRCAVIDVNTHHGKENPRLACQSQLRMPLGTQPFGARALEKAQVVGVIDDGAAVSVLPIHPRRPRELAH